MAEARSADKTEKATPQRLRKAREKGQVARSRELSVAVGLLVSLKLIASLLPTQLEHFQRLFRIAFAPLGGEGTLDNTWSWLFSDTMSLLFVMLLPLCIIPICIVAGSMFPGGWIFSTAQLKPDFGRLNPMQGIGRLFSWRHSIETIKSMFKVVLLGLVMYAVVRRSLPDFFRLQTLPFNVALNVGTDLLFQIMLAYCGVFILFAFVDLPLQIIMFYRSQRMTKQEVKDEYKSNEGRPEVRNRIRQLQRQIAQRSIKKAVPTADVIVVNPSHYAVALKYDEDRAEAPFIVAKGVDEMALYIRQIATSHKVEVVTLPPLARAIYNTTQVNQQIPAPLYKAVAYVLTYVLQLKAFRSGRRRTEPALPTELDVPREFSEQIPT